jgi:phosphonate transport system permease protein
MLGAVGAGNMGYLLNAYFRDQYFHEFGALLLGIILFTLLIENFSVSMRKKINKNINLKLYDQIKSYINQK